MSSLSLLKSSALAGMVGLGLVAMAAPASARTFTRCDYDGDRCVRLHCDWDGDDCWRQSSYYSRPYYSGYGRWQCDYYGDDCHWVYNHPYRYYRGYYDGPHVGIGLRF